MTNFIHKIKRSYLLQAVFWGIISLVLTLPLDFAKAAVPPGPIPGGSELKNPLNSDSFVALVESIAKLAAQIGIPIAAIFIIYSGLLFVTARGNEKQLQKARTNFVWALIGTGILLGAWIIAVAIRTTIESF